MLTLRLKCSLNIFKDERQPSGCQDHFFSSGMKRVLKDKKIIVKKLSKFLASVFTDEDDEMVSHTTRSL